MQLLHKSAVNIQIIIGVPFIFPAAYSVFKVAMFTAPSQLPHGFLTASQRKYYIGEWIVSPSIAPLGESHGQITHKNSHDHKEKGTHQRDLCGQEK